MDERVATRYAQALFNVAKGQKIVDAVSGDLNGIRDAMRFDPRLRAFVDDPTLSRDNKLKVLDTIFSDRVTALTMHLLRLLLQKRRDHLVENVASEFDRLRREDDNIQYVEVVSAQPLTGEQKEAIINKLATASGQKIEADFDVDETLIGGVRATLGNYVLDGSLKGALTRLKERLLYDVLKQI